MPIEALLGVGHHLADPPGDVPKRFAIRGLRGPAEEARSFEQKTDQLPRDIMLFDHARSDTPADFQHKASFAADPEPQSNRPSSHFGWKDIAA